MNISERLRAIKSNAIKCSIRTQEIDRIIELANEGLSTLPASTLTPAQQNADKMLVLLKTISKALDGKAAPLTKTTMQAIDMIIDDIEPPPVTIEAMAATLRVLIAHPSSSAVETAKRLLDRLEKPVALAPETFGYSFGCISKSNHDLYLKFKNAGWTDELLISHGYMS